VSWHPEDPRNWGGWHPQDPGWGRHRPTLGWGHPGRPLYDNQLGHRLPTGGPPAAGQLTIVVAIGLFLLSPVTLLAWAVCKHCCASPGCAGGSSPSPRSRP
jgi:hypothetical protein